ncbi:MAG: hypothetical protein JO183_10125 [Ktedonobacteraceae bacterium]|nr:hypothetical protein [Ktedonobacteraceae bacterium]MBV9019928.1 hypothetical protein [Ktedonobacteraceae bacterium]
MKDIVVLCDGSRVDEFVDAFKIQFEGDANIGVLWSGTMHRYGLGVIVLECEDDAEEFLHALQDDTDIFDFSEGPEDPIYVVRASGGNAPSC